MYLAKVPTTLQTSRSTAALLSKAVAANCRSPCHSQSLQTQPQRHFTSAAKIREFASKAEIKGKEIFPAPETKRINFTEAAWPHPPYSEEHLRQKVYFAHRDPQDFSDRVALWMVRFLRWTTDKATGYKHDVEVPKKASDSNAVTGTKPYAMSERKWLIRFVFLESVAGVPGMVAGTLRHLRSLRKLKRDNGWIATLLEEAYNERMHLLTFLKMYNPGIFMRTMILGAQGVFYNLFFACYILSPRTCHRFVGYLEEEAVLTYTLAVKDIEEGKLTKWADPDFKAPDIAVDYWKMPEGSRTMRDLLLYIRADEAKHREVNHTLGNLKQDEDPNPFVSEYKDESKPHPSKGIEHLKPTGWERDEVV